MQFYNRDDFEARSISAQQATSEAPQSSNQLSNLFPMEAQETLFNADMLALSEQITQQLPASDKRQFVSFRAIILIALVLAGVLFFIWWPTTSSTHTPAITQQSFSATASIENTANVSSGNTTGTGTTNGTKNTAGVQGGQIQVYIVGAVKNPGIYRMAAGARVYQLLQAAGGPLPDANLVSLNLAARLSDGQEVYVAKLGETAPAGIGSDASPVSQANTTTSTGLTAAPGTPVNINTASAAEMQKQLHIASTTAQNIVNYRLQHGDYTSVDQLLKVVRKTTYDKIKDMVTV